MMDDKQTDISSESAIFYVIGIGTEGCEALRYITDKKDYDGVTLVAIHSDSDALAKSGADKIVLLEIDKSMFDENGLPDDNTREYLASKLCAVIEKVDAFFILPGFREEKSSLLSTCICKLLSEKYKRGHSSFVLALANEPGRDEEPTQHKAFWLGYKQLLQHCDTVILNTQQPIGHLINQNQNTLANNLNQGFELNYQVIKSITDLIIRPGLVCFDFADAAAVFVNRGEAIMAIESAVGEGSVFRVVSNVFNELQRQWGLLSKLDIGGVLINVAAADVSLREFDVASTFFHLQVSSSTIIKIGTTLDNTMADKEIKVTVILVKDNADNVGSWSQYRKLVEE
jgi:cell division GTPase FtsZ